jgi:hypothetical protein
MTTPRDPDLDTRDLLHQDVLHPTDRMPGARQHAPAMAALMLAVLAMLALITLFMVLGVATRPG